MTRVEHLKEIVKQYDEHKKHLNKATKQGHIRITPETIYKSVTDLFKLKHNGQKIKELYECQNLPKQNELQSTIQASEDSSEEETPKKKNSKHTSRNKEKKESKSKSKEKSKEKTKKKSKGIYNLFYILFHFGHYFNANPTAT